jgi:hypothetical protein
MSQENRCTLMAARILAGGRRVSQLAGVEISDSPGTSMSFRLHGRAHRVAHLIVNGAEMPTTTLPRIPAFAVPPNRSERQ